MHARRLTIFAVASAYAWKVVDVAASRDWVITSLDNAGGADERLPNLRREVSLIRPMALGLSSAVGRAAAARAAFEVGFTEPISLVARLVALRRPWSSATGRSSTLAR